MSHWSFLLRKQMEKSEVNVTKNAKMDYDVLPLTKARVKTRNSLTKIRGRISSRGAEVWPK